MKRRNLVLTLFLIVIVVVASVVVIICCLSNGEVSYLQNIDEIYIMESGILRNNREWRNGEDISFSYDFSSPDFSLLLEQYDLEKTAGEGSEFEKALRVMNKFSPRLRHESNYDNHIEIRALPLLEYSLDNKKQGINCRNKAQMFNEMMLSLSIYSRKVWIMPYSGYDNECHVVNEIWDPTLNKWIMLDISNNAYWIDEDGVPLSLLEIREKGGNQTFCTPVIYGDDTKDKEKLRKKNESLFVYIMKNLAYFEYLDTYGSGENGTIYLLYPENMDTKYEYIISENSIISSPF